MNANNLDWNGQRFSPEEFPEGVLSQMDSRVIAALFDIRNALPASCPLWPSPLYGAHVRNDDTGSMHSLNHGRNLSRATDFFCNRSQANLVWLTTLMQPRVHGVGIYRNSLFKGSVNDFCMIHLDVRPHSSRAIWVADRENPSEPFTYYSLNKNPREFTEVLAKSGIFY